MSDPKFWVVLTADDTSPLSVRDSREEAEDAIAAHTARIADEAWLPLRLAEYVPAKVDAATLDRVGLALRRLLRDGGRGGVSAERGRTMAAELLRAAGLEVAA